MYAPVQPAVQIPGDRSDYIMARSGDLVGWSVPHGTTGLYIWRFGFLEGSAMAQACRVNTKKFFWFIATEMGEVLESFEGFGNELPENFNNIFNRDF